MRSHVVLLGDSIFDNGVYVPGEPDVVAQVRQELPDGWAATLRAVDGAVTADVPRQLGRLPRDATHLALSVGGNDALGYAHLLGAPARSVAQGVEILARAQARFATAYPAMLDAVLAVGLPTAVCTVYDTRITEPSASVIRAGLALFNDVITRAAFARGVTVLDLRLVCRHDADYANPIEPSAQGGRRIARTIAAWLVADGNAQRSSVFA